MKPRFFDNWAKEFNRNRQRSPIATDSWERLTDKGCKAEWLALWLALACEFEGAPGHSVLAPDKRISGRDARTAARLADRLDIDLEDLLKFYHYPGPGAPIQAIRTTVSDLRRIASLLAKRISARRLRPSLFLILLAAYVLKTTGREHYPDISNLLGTAYETFARTGRATGEGAIRKVVERFKKANPDLVTRDDNLDYDRLQIRLQLSVGIILTPGP